MCGCVCKFVMVCEFVMKCELARAYVCISVACQLPLLSLVMCFRPLPPPYSSLVPRVLCKSVGMKPPLNMQCTAFKNEEVPKLSK